MVAPTLLHYEVVNGLYQYQRVGLASAEYIQRIVEAALAVPVRLVGESDIHRSALEFATEFSLRASYDAHYLALADRLGIHFYTVDARLHRRVRSKLTWVHLVGGEGEL